MAVSMNSGFMRSDFMISDAALPMRMEELEQLEQTGKFAELLGGIGKPAQQTAVAEKAEAPAAEPTMSDEAAVTVIIPKSELKQLAQAVIKGEVKLDELPEELVSDVLLMAIAMIMLGVPEDDIAVLQEDYTLSVTEVQADTMAQFVELITVPKLNGEDTAYTSVTAFEIPEELKAEVQAVIKKIVGTEDELPEEAEMPEAQTEAPAAHAQTTAAHADGAAEIIAADNAPITEAKTESTEAKPTVIEAAAVITADNVNDVVASGDTAQQSDILPEQSKAQPVQAEADTAEQPMFKEEFEQLRKIISQVSVRKTDEQPAQQGGTAQVYTADEQMRSRVVSKAEELAILKNAAEPVQQTEQPEAIPVTEAKAMPEMNIASDTAAKSESSTNNADSRQSGTQPAVILNAPQTAMPEATVVITRADGTEIAVKPEEIIEQVVTKVVEQTTNADGDTEYSVTLEPEDLGSITVRMTKTADGTFTVSITAENARTQRIIEESAMALQNSLKQNGIELESWQTVNESEQQERAEDYNGSSKNPYYREEQSENEDAEDTSFAEMISAV